MKKLSIVFLLVGMFFGTLISLHAPVSAQQNNELRWIEAGTLEFRGQRYYDRNFTDSDLRAQTAKTDSCSDDARGVIRYSDDRSKATSITVRDPNIGGCPEVDTLENIPIRNPNTSTVIGYRANETEILVFLSANSGDRAVLVPFRSSSDGDPNRYFFSGDLGNDIVNDGMNGMSIVVNQSGQITESPDGDYNSYRLANNGAITQPDSDTPIAGDSSLDGEAAGDDSCESQGGPLGWIMCPVILLFDGALNWLDTQIQGLLEVDTDKYTNPELRAAWVNFRNIAYIILIPIMLVMVIGTALGFEVFSAYTVKKALPRMVIAVIFITLSWYITTFLIGFFNTLGGGILGLMTQPFGESGNMNLATLFGTSGSNVGDVASTLGSSVVQWGAGATIVVGLGAIIATPGGIGILLLSLVSAALIIFTAFTVLVLRQMFIIGLTLLAPLAILAWIFPGNDKLWKLWWGTFSKLLMMFPLIMVIIASGRIFAWLINESGGGGAESILNPLLKLVAYVIPYLLIPATFKFAGGVFANLSGMINDSERGVFDRLRNARGNAAKGMHEGIDKDRTKFGGALGQKLTGNRLHSAYQRTSRFGRDGSFSRTAAGRQRWQEYGQKSSEASADEMLEAGGGRALNDDDASELLRLQGQTRDGFIKAYAAKMLKDGRTTDENEATQMGMRALTRAEQALGAKVGTDSMVIAAQKFRTSMTNTAYDPGEAGMQKLQDDLQDLQARGLITAADAAGWMKANRGRSDFSANGFNDTISFVTRKSSAREQIAGAFRGADPREIVGGHQRAVEAFAEQAAINLDAAVKSADPAQIDKALADAANIHTALSNISAKKGDTFVQEVLSRGSGLSGVRIDPATGVETERQLSYRELVDEARSSPSLHQAFHDRVREYSTGRESAAAGAAAEGVAPQDESH